jgi:tRNA pseudouridine38-40 synthase
MQGESSVDAKSNFKLVLEYDGCNYHGWQRQKGVLTIQEVVEARLEIMTQAPVRLEGAGRTDAGVHARGQVANFFSKTLIPPARLLQGLNSLLPEDIVGLELTQVPRDFHARFQASSKVYEYRIHNGPMSPALGRQYVWHISQPLDWDLMARGIQTLKGRHNFGSFQAAGSSVRDPERTVFSARIDRLSEHLWSIVIEADGFLRHMVRNIVGTLVDVGRRQVTLERFSAIMAAHDRKQAGMTAPARGLCLVEVRY